MDHGSASASEILSGALRDNHRATVIGDETTYGKGRIQSVYEMVRAGRGAAPPLGARARAHARPVGFRSGCVGPASRGACQAWRKAGVHACWTPSCERRHQDGRHHRMCLHNSPCPCLPPPPHPTPHIRPQDDGSALFVTVARYRTPSGAEIDLRGIRPDVGCAPPLRGGARPASLGAAARPGKPPGARGAGGAARPPSDYDAAGEDAAVSSIVGLPEAADACLLTAMNLLADQAPLVEATAGTVVAAR